MKSEKGFTLIELLAVIVILGILAIIIIPSVTTYVNDTRGQTYIAHENSMINAAKVLTVETLNGNTNIELPTIGEKKRVYLSDLENEELIQTLNNPKGGSCNSNLSYVTITNNNGNYEYDACLYCGDYSTDNPDCDDIPDDDDSTPPVCGTITGASSEWTNQNRTITVECSDEGVGCTQEKVSKTFRETSKNGFITISDRKGNTTDCPVMVYVDKTPPTCELQMENGVVEDTGWISGTDIQISFKPNSLSDGENQSGVLTYGVNTSMKNPSFNKSEVYYIRDTTGTTTVIGHVKDNAGNEGMCSKTVTTGVESPRFDIRYGFQIYPNKDRMVLNNATHSGVGEIHTGEAANGKGIITFTNMGYYSNVTRVAMTLVSPVEDPAAFKLTVNGRTYSATTTDYKNLEFYIENNSDGNTISANEYQITLGENNKDYNITRIELQRTDGELRSRYEVSVNLYQKKQLMKATSFSFDGGRSYGSSPRALMDTRYEEKYGEARAKNEMQLASPGVQYHIAKGDGSAPDVNVSLSTEDWTNQDVRITANITDNESGIVAYVISDEADVDYYSDKWIYLSSPTSTQALTRDVGANGNFNIYVKDFAGNTVRRVASVSNIDKNAPSCTLGASSITCADTPAALGQGQSKVNRIYVGSSSNPSDSDFKIVPVGSSYTEDIEMTEAGTYYLYAKDRAGNISPVQYDAYYVVHYDANGGSNPTKTTTVVKRGANIDLSVRATTYHPDYSLAGWHTDPNSYEPLTSLTATQDTTLYAIWLYKYTTIMRGVDFNLKLKGIAGDNVSPENYSGTYDRYYVNTSITRIVRSTTRPDASILTDEHRISASKSKYPVYAWFDANTGIMYWWSLENEKLYFPASSSRLFMNMVNLVSIDFDNMFDLSEATNLNDMFYGCSSLVRLDTSNWDISNVKDLRSAFANCGNLREIDVSNWDTSNVRDLSSIFSGCSSLREIDVSKWDTSKVTEFTCMFAYCNSLKSLDVSNWDISKADDLFYMFCGCESLEYLDVSKWDTSNVDRMTYLFCSCHSLKNLDVSKWNTSKVETMNNLFYWCESLTSIDVSKWDVSNVTNFDCMFLGCKGLTTIDVSKWNISKAEDIGNIFALCDNLRSVDVSKWNTSNVTRMSGVFYGCENLESIDVSKWNTSKVTSLGGYERVSATGEGLGGSGFPIFYGCKKLRELDLSGWDTSNVTRIYEMFYGCSNLERIYVSDSFVVSAVLDPVATNFGEYYVYDYKMFSGNDKLVGGAGSKPQKNTSYGKDYAHIDEGPSNPGFFTRKNS